MKGGHQQNPLRLKSLNHVSMLCRSLPKSVDFYTNLLGFAPVRRPRSLSFNGAWLFGFGIGIHLLQTDDLERLPEKNREIDPRDRHISFQCDSMATVEEKLNDMGLAYKKARVEEAGVFVDQIFFHDPDGFMIEVCDCENLPIVPIVAEEMVRSCSSLSNVDAVHQKQLQEMS